MDVTQLTAQLEQVMKLNEELREQHASMVQMIEPLREDNAALRQQLDMLRPDYEALLTSTQTLIDDRDKLQRRMDELEAINQRLVDMLWGRRSERRLLSPDQLSLDFGEEPTPSEEEQNAIMAQLQADKALDEQLVRDAEARRQQRRKKSNAKRKSSPNTSSVASGSWI